MPQIFSVIRCETGLQLSSQQVRSLYKKAANSRNVSETEQLNVVSNILGKTMGFLDDIWEI